MKKLVIVIILIILGGVAVAGGWWWYQRQMEQLPEGIVKVNGRFELGRMDVASLYPGRIEALPVIEGQEIAAGQVVARLSSEETQALFDAAQAARDRVTQTVKRAEAETSARIEKQRLAELEFKNAKALQKDSLVSSVEVERRQRALAAETAAVNASLAAEAEARAGIREAEAQVQRISSVKKDLEIRAPRAGRIEYRIAELGRVIPAGGKVITILDPSDAYMSLFLPTYTMGQVRIGSDARIILDGIDAVFPAKVSFIASEAQFTPKYVETADERTKMMYRVKLQLSADLALKYKDLIKGGLTGNGYVRLTNEAPWPLHLNEHLPGTEGQR